MTKKIQNRLGMGKKSAQLLSELAEQNKSIFTIDEALKILKEKRSSAAKLLHDLARKKWLFHISKGKYMIVPLEAGARPEFTEHEFIIASHLIQPYYISYWSALNYYGFTEQVSKTIFVATIKRKKEKALMGLKFKFITIRKSKFFGFKEVSINNRTINIAEKEKTIIDCLDLPRNCGGIIEVIKAIDNAREELDFNKLVDYVKRMGSKAIINRLGYICDLLKIKIELKPSRHYVFLDPLTKNKGKYNNKWKIIENIPEKELLSWKEH